MARKRGPLKGGISPLFVVMCVIGFTFGYLIWFNSNDTNITQLKYSEFVTALKDGKVAEVEVDEQFVAGKFHNEEKKFYAFAVQNERLWTLLEKSGAAITVKPTDRQNWFFYFFLMLLLFSIIPLIFFFYAKQSQGGMGGGMGKIFNVGKSRAKFIPPNAIKVSFKDVAGLVEAKEELSDVIQFLKSPEKFSRLGAKIPRGILLSGDPGNGKTLLARAVAGEAKCPFFSISGSDFVEVFVGVGASRVRDLFTQAKRHTPCIVFIDELDTVGRQRGAGIGGGNDEREQTLNQLLSEMDGFSTEPGAVIVLAATNRVDVLDKALMRPGRFDRILNVPYPDITCRKHILEVHLKKVKLAKGVNVQTLAKGTPGCSGADLENLVNEAALAASKADKRAIEMIDFELARDKLFMGEERKTLVLSDSEKECTAYHEAGHTIVNMMLPEFTDPLHKVTITPRGRALGVSWFLPEADRHSEFQGRMEAYIKVALGGRIAEQLIFKEVSSGAMNDLENATEIARKMVCHYGMSNLGPISFGSRVRKGMAMQPEYSEATANKIDEEVSRIVIDAYKDAEEILKSETDKLHSLAKELLEKETLFANEVYDLLGVERRGQDKEQEDSQE
ncbi:ATP-dependent zinc metalloprotease FtsH [bacterium]|nr:ATP-dependent zinc metalloprotease FtsH [bacterium]